MKEKEGQERQSKEERGQGHWQTRRRRWEERRGGGCENWKPQALGRERWIPSFPGSTAWSVVADSTVLSVQGNLCHGEKGVERKEEEEKEEEAEEAEEEEEGEEKGEDNYNFQLRILPKGRWNSLRPEGYRGESRDQ